MSTPAIPTNVFSSQGNQSAYISWDLMPGATIYLVQRSTNQINYVTVATPTANQYLDTAVTLGTAYYYQVAAATSTGSYATWPVTFVGQPLVGDKIKLNGVSFTVGTDFALGSTVAQTIQNLVAAVNATASLLYVVSASGTSTVATFTSVAVGTPGNAILFEDDLTNTTAPSAGFAGGVDPDQSAYSAPVSAVPAMSGEMSLGELRLRAQQRADRVNSDFLTKTEWNFNINNSLFELYDLLIDIYEDYFLSPPYQFTTNGSSTRYPLPNGVLTFTNTETNTVEIAPPFYKLWGVDLAANTTPQGYVTMRKFNPLDRNKYFYPNSQSTIYGVFNAQYRLLDKYIEFIPVPSGNQFIRLRYFPRMATLLADSDLTTSGVSGWLEYVIVDAAIKALTKEESDTTSLKMDKAALKLRIEAGAKNRDAGWPDTIQDSRSGGTGGLGYGGGWGGTQGGW